MRERGRAAAGLHVKEPVVLEHLANVAQEELQCKRCKSELELYDFHGDTIEGNDSIKERNLLEDSKIDEFGWYENVDFPCPKCKKPMMRIGVFGCWD